MSLPVLYLHGFASDPSSSKAGVIGSLLRSRGHLVAVPDLNAGDFSDMTVSRSVEIARKTAAGFGRPFAVIGSSLGGYTAALLAASEHENVRGIFLMAPAFGPASLWTGKLKPDELSRWEREGSVLVDHYSWGRKEPLSYGFIRDLERHPPFPSIGTIPCVIAHGERDESVPIRMSEEFVRRNPHAVLKRFDDAHDLAKSVDVIARMAADFIGCLLYPHPRIRKRS